MENIENDEMITTQETLKIYHDQKIAIILNAYPPEKGFEVSILECLPIDSKTERITFSVKKVKNLASVGTKLK